MSNIFGEVFEYTPLYFVSRRLGQYHWKGVEGADEPRFLTDGGGRPPQRNPGWRGHNRIVDISVSNDDMVLGIFSEVFKYNVSRGLCQYQWKVWEGQMNLESWSAAGAGYPTATWDDEVAIE